MTTYRFIGDVHGKYRQYRTILKNSPYPTIQVGDMGVGFRKWPHGEWQTNPSYDDMVKYHARFIRGNHDNPSVCLQHKRFIQDGTVEDNMMFVGGAVSIDKAWRYPEFSWWEDEELSSDELTAIVGVYSVSLPEIMVTHDCPEFVAKVIAGDNNVKLDPQFSSRTRQAFDSMAGIHKPKLWVFGHWHVPFDWTFEGTRFVCLPELATMDVDTNNINADLEYGTN